MFSRVAKGFFDVFCRCRLRVKGFGVLELPAQNAQLTLPRSSHKASWPLVIPAQPWTKPLSSPLKQELIREFGEAGLSAELLLRLLRLRGAFSPKGGVAPFTSYTIPTIPQI